jgi:hypothetical protein
MRIARAWLSGNGDYAKRITGELHKSLRHCPNAKLSDWKVHEVFETF